LVVASKGVQFIATTEPFPVVTLDEDFGEVMSVGTSSNWIAAGNWDGDLKIWDAASRVKAVAMRAHPLVTSALTFSPDGKALATGGGDNKIHFWDLTALRPGQQVLVVPRNPGTLPKIKSFQGHRAEIITLAYSPDGGVMLSGSADGAAKFWSPAFTRKDGLLPTQDNPLRFSADGTELLTLDTNGTVSWRTLASGRKRVLITCPVSQLDRLGRSAAAVSADFKTLALRTTDASIELWDISLRKSLARLRSGRDSVVAVRFCPGEASLAVVTEDPQPDESNLVRVILWDYLSDRTQELDRRPGAGAHAIAFSPNGKQLVSGCMDGAIRVWDLPHPSKPRVLEGHSSGISELVFSGDGKQLASASFDSTIRIWDTTTWEFRVLRGHTGGVEAAAFSDDGKFLVSDSGNALKLWDAATGQERLNLNLSSGMFLLEERLRTAPDGSALAVRIGLQYTPDGLLLLRAPPMAEIEAREKAKAEAQADAPTFNSIVAAP
jgi:WD40 repeat protein